MFCQKKNGGPEVTSSRVRERNERGFTLFLQNLKSVVSLLTTIGEQELETDILVETRCRLLDASGMVSLLIDDVTRSDTNVIAIPSSVLQEPLQDLKHLLGQLISFLSDVISWRENVGFYNELNVSYCAPLSHEQMGRGREHYEITKDRLEHLRSLYFLQKYNWQFKFRTYYP